MIMAELSSLDPTNRFTGLAQTYAKFRPSYPARAMDYIMARCGLNQESLLIDVGCGTGIASRLIAVRGVNVIGIEPNFEMRCAATDSVETVGPKVTYREGRAESTGLASEVADAVLCAQAFHWFEPIPTLREFHRVLKPGGWTILMWNERDERDPITAAYGDVIRTASEAAAIEGPRQRNAGDALRTSPLFGQAEQVTFHNQQALDEEGLLGRAFSSSFAPLEGNDKQLWADRLRGVFHQYQREGTVALRYMTTLYLAQRNNGRASE
jgi:ubiquinone/menaquinone biosynthesis C-methylase UbiE